MRRGDIVLVAGGVCARKPRPALLAQDDFSTTEVDAPLLRVPLGADDSNGLDEDSYAMVDKLTTVRRSNAGKVVGRIGEAQLVEIERRLRCFWDLRDYLGRLQAGAVSVSNIGRRPARGLFVDWRGWNAMSVNPTP